MKKGFSSSEVLVMWACIFMFCFLVLVESRHYNNNNNNNNNNKHLKEPHYGMVSHISQPPSASAAPPQEAQPPSGGGGDGMDSAAANSSEKIFNVLSYGAVGNGVTDDTQAFKMAWDDACHADISSLLLIPNRYTFMIQSTIFTGPCRNQLVFQIEGTMMPPDGPDSWAVGSSKRQWVVFYRIDGMSIQGGGRIDGRGEKWWNLPCMPHKKGVNGTTVPAGPCDSPVMIRFFMSSKLKVQGLMVKNSPHFNFRFDSCHDVHVDSLFIKAPALSPNTDGIHIENTNDVKIYDSVISNGDDCVSIGAGCFNVDIRNITCGPSHGISIGSLGSRNSRACVSNITVSDSFIKHSDNGVRIKTWQGGLGDVSHVTFNNIHMDTVRNPIIIDQYYCDSKHCPNQTSAVYVTNILYTNIKGTYDIRSPSIRFACSDTIACTNLTLSDVELFPAIGQQILDPFCWNAYGNSKTITVPPAFCLMEGYPESSPAADVDQC